MTTPYPNEQNPIPAEITVWRRGEPLQKKRLRVVRVDDLTSLDTKPGTAGFILPPLLGKKHHAVTHVAAPEYTMRPFIPSNTQLQGFLGPGAGHYKVPDNVTHHGKFYPLGQPFGHKFGTAIEKRRVGPWSHKLPLPDVYLFRNPRCLILPYRPLRYSFYSDSILLHGPMIGPKVTTKVAAQAVTMKGGRRNVTSVEDVGPDPGKYVFNDYKRRPAWTMAGRLRSPLKDNVIGPKYSLENVRNLPRAPAWVMGQKSNERTRILRTPCDVIDYKHLDKLY